MHAGICMYTLSILCRLLALILAILNVISRLLARSTLDSKAKRYVQSIRLADTTTL